VSDPGVVGQEQLDLLEADVMFVFPSPEARPRIESSPVFQQLAAVQRGSYVPLDLDLALSIGFPWVLSIPYGLSRIVPKIQAALGG
jgi:iron complex transport system substrate-binding protein